MRAVRSERRHGLAAEKPALGRQLVTLASAVVALAGLAGCVHVAPYERGTLAHPTMTADDPYKTPLAAHVEDVSEGAIGGFSGGGGGCGCN